MSLGVRQALSVCVAAAIVAGGACERRRDTDAPAALAAAIADIEAGRQATPLIGEAAPTGDVPVTFVAKRVDGREPRIVSDVTGWGEHTDGTFDFGAGAMARVGQTEWYALQARVAPRARIEYLIAYAPSDYRLDPHNPRQSGGPQRGGAPASEFVMPGYVAPPDLAETMSVPAGRLADARVESRATARAWRVIVYTPPGHDPAREYPVAVFLDLRAGLVSRVIDRLIARRAIPPIAAAFVGPMSNAPAHAVDDALRPFLVDELPSWMASRDGGRVKGAWRAILGISFGARDAIDVALAPPESPGAFDAVGLLIPGRRIDRAALEAVARAGHRVTRATILAGQYDRANLDTARGLRQALETAGHRVDYIEVPEGHSAVTWTNHVGDVLVSLFGVGR